MSHAYATVAELVPVADAALTARPHDDVVRDIRRALLRHVGCDVFQACDIGAEAIVQAAEAGAHLGDDAQVQVPDAGIRLASDYPGYGDEGGPRG